jgi:sigma-B regulation protein RsbU (phosphoserine phosphatase)
MDEVRRPRGGILHLLLLSLFPLLLLYALLSFLALGRAPDFGMSQRLFEITKIVPNGPAARAGFRLGDRVESVNGIPVGETVRLLKDHGRIRPGHTVAFAVRRGSETHDLSVTAGEKPRVERLRDLARTVVGLCFLLVGLVVYRNRADTAATAFYLVGVLFAFSLIEPPATGDIRLQALIKIARDASVLFLPPLFLHFVLLFPHEKKIPRRLFFLRPLRLRGRTLLRFPLHAVSLAIFAATALITFRIYTTGRMNPGLLSLFQLLAAFYLMFCFVAGVAAFIHSYAHTANLEMRKKLRGVLIGTTAALLPIGVYSVLRQVNTGWEVPWDPVLTLLVALLPISFGHAIIRYRLLDFELILKRGVLYALLTAFLATVYLVLVDLASRVLRGLVGGSDIPATLLSLFFIALLFSPARDAIQKWVDRTFYREKYEHRKTLHEFSSALTTILDRETLLRLLVDRISSALHIPKVAVFLRDSKSKGLLLRAETGPGTLGAESALFAGTERPRLPEFLREQAGVLPIERLASGGSGWLTDADRDELRRLDTALLLPLVSGEEMVGIISLGRKRSGELYSHEDRQLLKTLANHAALAIENSDLHHSVIEKEKMERELRLAREIQLGFLPRRAPELSEVAIGALNAPCRTIGGDYYDFLVTRPHGLGLAIADAAGHGVPAALLMANLQATFRVEALTRSSPAEVLSRVNAFAARQSQESHFVTCFYGLIDLRSGMFRFANAGHIPPLLVGADGSCRRLEDSDLLLGVEDGIVYREHAVDLSPGDLLVLHTDGVTDEPNRNDESFGWKRFQECVVANRRLDPSDLCNLILRNVMEFMEGEPGDDITLVAVRYL